MSFTIEHQTSGSVEIMRMAGRLVLGDGTSAVREAIHSAVNLHADILVDLTGVTYVDSAGLGELVAGYTAITAGGRAMKLLRPGERVDSLLHITKLYSTFEVFENEDDALKSFGAGR